MAAPPPPPPGLERLDELLAGLRGHGFAIGIDHYLKCYRLIACLAERGELPVRLDDLAPWLGPLLCSSPQEQRRFRTLFDVWAQGVGEPLPAIEEEPATAEPAPQQRVPVVDPAHARRRWTRAGLWVLAALALLGLALMLLPPTEPPATTSAEVATGTAPSGGLSVWLGDLLARLGQWLPTAFDPAELSPPRLAAIALPWLLAIVFWIGLRRWRIGLVRGYSLRRFDEQRIELPGLDGALFRGGPVRRHLQTFRRHRAVATRELDVPRTIRATVTNCGLPELHFRQRPVSSDYLILFNSRSLGDHQADIARQLHLRMRDNEIPHRLYRFAGDPRHLIKEGGPDGAPPEREEIRELAVRTAGATLIVVDDGRVFVDPISEAPWPWIEQFEAWGSRLVLSPVPPAEWGTVERVLSDRGFTVLPADSDGLRDWAFAIEGGAATTPDAVPVAGAAAAPPSPLLDDGLAEQWLANRAPPAAERARLLALLRDQLGGAGLYWLAACAIFPRIHPALTRHLGHRLTDPAGRPLMNEASLLRLARLPWLRDGRIPDWLRVELINTLEPEQEQRARSELTRVLAAPTGDGAAPQGPAIEVVARPGLHQLERLIALARHRGGALSEQIFLDFLRGRKPLAVDLPEGAGWRPRLNALRLPAVLATLLLLSLAIWRQGVELALRLPDLGVLVGPLLYLGPPLAIFALIQWLQATFLLARNPPPDTARIVQFGSRAIDLLLALMIVLLLVAVAGASLADMALVHLLAVSLALLHWRRAGRRTAAAVPLPPLDALPARPLVMALLAAAGLLIGYGGLQGFAATPPQEALLWLLLYAAVAGLVVGGGGALALRAALGLGWRPIVPASLAVASALLCSIGVGGLVEALLVAPPAQAAQKAPVALYVGFGDPLWQGVAMVPASLLAIGVAFARWQPAALRRAMRLALTSGAAGALGAGGALWFGVNLELQLHLSQLAALVVLFAQLRPEQLARTLPAALLLALANSGADYTGSDLIGLQPEQWWMGLGPMALPLGWLLLRGLDPPQRSPQRASLGVMWLASIAVLFACTRISAGAISLAPYALLPLIALWLGDRIGRPALWVALAGTGGGLLVFGLTPNLGGVTFGVGPGLALLSLALLLFAQAPQAGWEWLQRYGRNPALIAAALLLATCEIWLRGDFGTVGWFTMNPAPMLLALLIGMAGTRWQPASALCATVIAIGIALAALGVGRLSIELGNGIDLGLRWRLDQVDELAELLGGFYVGRWIALLRGSNARVALAALPSASVVTAVLIGVVPYALVSTTLRFEVSDARLLLSGSDGLLQLALFAAALLLGLRGFLIGIGVAGALIYGFARVSAISDPQLLLDLGTAQLEARLPRLETVAQQLLALLFGYAGLRLHERLGPLRRRTAEPGAGLWLRNPRLRSGADRVLPWFVVPLAVLLVPTLQLSDRLQLDLSLLLLPLAVWFGRTGGGSGIVALGLGSAGLLFGLIEQEIGWQPRPSLWLVLLAFAWLAADPRPRLARLAARFADGLPWGPGIALAAGLFVFYADSLAAGVMQLGWSGHWLFAALLCGAGLFTEQPRALWPLVVMLAAPFALDLLGLPLELNVGSWVWGFTVWPTFAFGLVAVWGGARLIRRHALRAPLRDRLDRRSQLIIALLLAAMTLFLIGIEWNAADMPSHGAIWAVPLLAFALGVVWRRSGTLAVAAFGAAAVGYLQPLVLALGPGVAIDLLGVKLSIASPSGSTIPVVAVAVVMAYIGERANGALLDAIRSAWSERAAADSVADRFADDRPFDDAASGESLGPTGGR